MRLFEIIIDSLVIVSLSVREKYVENAICSLGHCIIIYDKLTINIYNNGHGMRNTARVHLLIYHCHYSIILDSVSKISVVH